MASDKTHITLLYLHRHRLNDINNWLKSLAKVTSLQVLLVVSDSTQTNIDLLLETGHEFDIYNIQSNEAQYSIYENGPSILILYREIIRLSKNFTQRYKAAANLLECYPKSVLITYDDRMSGLLPILKAAFDLNVPVFLPAILTTSPDITATTSNILSSKRKVESLIAYFVKWFSPNHVNSDGRMFYGAPEYLNLLRFGSLPKHPWIKGTLKYTTILGVESKLAYEKLLSQGVNKNKMVLTGMPIFDLMELSACKDKIDFQEKILVCALPQYAEHGAMSWDQAIPVLEDIFLAFKKYDGRVIISLHPRMDKSLYQPLVDKFGYECASKDLNYLLPYADVFFCASSSTTIYWSLILGIQTVVFNHTYPKSNLFKDYESLVYIENNAIDEIESALNKVPNFDNLINKDQKALSADIAMNNACGSRNLEVINSLLGISS